MTAKPAPAAVEATAATATAPARYEFPVSKYLNRFSWSWGTTVPLMIIWGVTADKGGDQWPIATAYMAGMIMIWATPTAEQIVNMIQAGATLRSDPATSFGFSGYGASTAGVEGDPNK